jgi:hypothetical protein
MPALVPQVGGVLEATPVARLLVHALDARFAGTLVLEESAGFRHGIQFENGVPRKAKTGCPVAYLGELLVEAGALTQQLYQATLDRALAERRLHGRVLTDQRIVNERQLVAGLREQLSRQVLWMFGRPPDTRFGFFPGSNLLENWGAAEAGRVDALELIWRGIRDHSGQTEIERTLEEIAGRRLMLREDMPFDYFFFMGDDRLIVEQLQAGAGSWEQLVRTTGAAPDRVLRVLCLLALTRALDLGFRTSPPLGLESNEPAPLSIPATPRVPDVPDSRTPTQFTVEVSAGAYPSEAPAAPAPPVEERVNLSGVRTPLPPASDAPTAPADAASQVKGRPGSASAVPPAASAVRPEAGDVPLAATEFHAEVTVAEVSEVPVEPTDAPPGPRDPRREASSAPPAAAPPGVTPPHVTSSFPPRRPSRSTIPEVVSANIRMKELARRRAERPDSTEDDRASAASAAFERAEALASHGNLTAARRELGVALHHDPQPAYLAMNAWFDIQEPRPDLQKISRDLERAYRLAENHPTVRFYRGLVLQRLGKHAAALREFRFVVEKVPHHIDAARQVRIYEARLRESPRDRPSLLPPDPASRPRSGLFSWLRRAKP